MRRVLERIRRFTGHPVTRMVMGLILVVSSIAEGYDTFFDDVSHLRLRAHHGLLLFGLMNVLSSLPDLIEGLETSVEVIAARTGEFVEEEEGDDAPAGR